MVKWCCCYAVGALKRCRASFGVSVRLPRHHCGAHFSCPPGIVLPQVDWMEQRMPYYPPTVNDPEAYKFAIDVAGRWVERSWVVGEQR